MKDLSPRKFYTHMATFSQVFKALLQMKQTEHLKLGFSPSLEMPFSVYCMVIWDRAISFTSVDTALLCIAELRPNEQEKVGFSP